MDNDSFTSVTQQSWGSRLSQSVSGMVIGAIFFLGAFPLLYWNEGRAVDRAKTLEQGAALVISVAADDVDPGHEGKLVHTSGLATTDEQLTDPEFNITENAIALQREVEMYQWIEEQHSETREKLGGGTETVTSYTYRKGWSASLQQSSGFRQPEGHRNPTAMALTSSSHRAERVMLGAYRLAEGQIDRIDKAQSLPLAERALPPRLANKPLTRQGDTLFLGERPSDPQVGDLRVKFEVVRPTTISVVAQQRGSSFTPFSTETGSISLLEYGDMPAAAMFQSAQTSNTILTWVLRLVGFLVMFIGIKVVLAPLRTLAAVVPLFASVVGFISGTVAFLLAAALSLVVIAVAWLAARPLLGGLLLGGAVAALVATRWLGRGGQAPPPARPAATPPPPPPPPPRA